MQSHRCGGTLKPTKITIRKTVGNLYMVFTVDGLRCTQCSEELVSRNTARALEQVVSEFKDRRFGPMTTAETPQIVLRSDKTTTGGVVHLTMNSAATPTV